MPLLVRSIKWIMLAAGLLTVTMVYAAIAPEAAFQSTFGEPIGGGPAAVLVVRNWGLLITLVGVMLILGAFRPAGRRVALAVAAASKAGFIALVLAEGGRFLRYQAGVAVAIDAVIVLLFLTYLLAAPRGAGPAES